MMSIKSEIFENDIYTKYSRGQQDGSVVKGPAAKPDDLSLTPGTHVIVRTHFSKLPSDLHAQPSLK